MQKRFNLIFASITFFVVISLYAGNIIDQSKSSLDKDGKTAWYNGEILPIEGRGFNDTEQYYDRLPARAKESVPGAVWNLSHHSAGMALHFVSDGGSFKIRWELKSKNLAMPHMPATGVSGVDVYKRTPEGWRFVKNGRPRSFSNEVAIAISPKTECLVYLPLYNGIKEITIGIPKEKSLSLPPARPNGITKPVLIYGTSITQGGCASRPGMAFTAIAGRLVDAPVVNLGFSGNGRMEMALCDLIAEIDTSIYVLDCLWNMNDSLVKKRAEPFIRALQKKRPDTPILLAEDCNVFERAPTPKSKIMRGIYDKLKAEDPTLWKKLHYLAAKEMLGHDYEGTVDGCHPNDLGMMRQGKVYGNAIKEILKR